MQGRRTDAYAVLVAEWVVGDEGVPVRLGDRVSWHVRPADEADEASAARLIAEDRVAAGQAELTIFALHADDPEPPISLVGEVTLIQALCWSHPSDGERRLLSQRMVERARINEGVEDYLVHVEGAVAARY